jgi:hypothetical protein
VKPITHALTAVGLAILVCSCTTPSGTHVQLDPSSLGQIKTLGVYVKTKDSFSVYMSRDRMTATGAVIGGLIGAGIEAGVRSSEDDKVLQKVRPNLGDFEVQSALATNLERQLQQTGLFSAVRRLDTADQRTVKAAGVDAILEVDVLQWGLLVCSATSMDDRLQVGIVTHERLATVAGDRKLWVSDETHLDGDCHFASEFETKLELLRQLLNRAVDALTGRTANEIRYPSTNANRRPQ